MMKKGIALLLALALCLAMTACGADNTTNTGSSAPGSASSAGEEGSTPSGEDAGNSDAAYTLVEDGYLTMATNAYFPPYEYYDEGNQIVGIDVEIAEAIAEKLGLELKIEDMEFNSIIGAVQAGRADIGLAGMTITEDRLQNVDFSTSYATGIQVVIVREDSGIETLDDLTAIDGFLIGVQLSTTGDIYCVDDYGQEHVDEYNKGNDAIMALVNGKVDAVIIDNEPAKNFVAANSGLKILETEYTAEDYAAALAKDNTALTEAVNAALAELEQDGTLQQIVDKYITTN